MKKNSSWVSCMVLVLSVLMQNRQHLVHKNRRPWSHAGWRKIIYRNFSPVNPKHDYPILIQRTPMVPTLVYQTIQHSVFLIWDPTTAVCYQEGYFLVIQDIRGKYKSEGTMQIHQPITHVKEKNTVDESTDTWDTVDWLIKPERQ